MELHTSHSTERDIQAMAAVASPMSTTAASSSLNWPAAASAASHSTEVSRNARSKATHKANRVVQLIQTADNTSVVNDGTESRGSYSPKSYDSASSHSLDDKVASDIRKVSGAEKHYMGLGI